MDSVEAATNRRPALSPGWNIWRCYMVIGLVMAVLKRKKQFFVCALLLRDRSLADKEMKIFFDVENQFVAPYDREHQAAFALPPHIWTQLKKRRAEFLRPAIYYS